jgi:pimeloyl-ACP methyl ester carboxylesterase
VLVVHGAHEDGRDHPALVALARAYALRGATVGVLDLPTLRRYEIDVRDPGRVRDAALWLATRGDLSADGRVALFGISVGGSYALLAAADLAASDRVSCVFAFGAYPELTGLLRRALTRPPPADPALYGQWRRARLHVLLGNARAVVPDDERVAVERSLQAVLDGTTVCDPPGLSELSRLVLSTARAMGEVPDADARRLLAPLARTNSALSPALRDAVPGAPVYLLQGVDDPIVPAADAERLREALARRGADVRLFATDLDSHVDPDAESPSLLRAWSLLRFVGDALSDAGL